VLDNLSVAEAFFKKHRDMFQWVPPDGGSTAFPKLLPPFDVTEMCERAMKEKSMLIIGERAYGLTNNHFRIGLGRRDFCETLDVFGELVEEMAKEAGMAK